MKAAYLEVGLKSNSPAGRFSERLRQLRINGVKILFNNIDKHRGQTFANVRTYYPSCF